MQKAREAFATAAGLDDVQVGDVPGMSELLRVRAVADHDWQKTATEMAPHGWWFQAFRADDATALVRAELAKVPAAAAGDLAAQQRAWQVLGQRDRELAERLVVPALEQIVARRATVWDPRLEEVADVAAALRAFWSEVAPALPPAEFVGDATLAERVRWTIVRPAREHPELVAARREVPSLGERRLATLLVWHRLAAVCAEVQAHAQRTADRAREEKTRQAYRELAAQCADVAAALALLRGP